MYCPKCKASGRGLRDVYTLLDDIPVPALGDNQELYDQYYNEIKPYIVQCVSCESEDFSGLFPSGVLI